jgi:hypothetical protein
MSSDSFSAVNWLFGKVGNPGSLDWVWRFPAAIFFRTFLSRLAALTNGSYFTRFNDAYYPAGHEGYALLLCHVFLLIAWSWTSGYVIGAVSRRTVLVSIAVLMFPSVKFLDRCFFPALPAGWMFLFLAPAILGVHSGLRKARVPFYAASLLAFAVSTLMLVAWENKALWIYNWVLVWPAWFLIAKNWQSNSCWPSAPATYTNAF